MKKKMPQKGTKTQKGLMKALYAFCASLWLNLLLVFTLK
jgi:hypothetical protein